MNSDSEIKVPIGAADTTPLGGSLATELSHYRVYAGKGGLNIIHSVVQVWGETYDILAACDPHTGLLKTFGNFC